MHGFRVLAALIAVSLLASCLDQKPQTPVQQERSEAIFDYVMAKVPKYVAYEDAKAMAACIRWAGGKEKRDKVVSIRWFVTARTSDGNFSANQLLNSSMTSCEQEEEGTEGCTCHRLALNNSNVLRAP